MDREKCLEILGVDLNASANELRQTYKDLVSVWHPDRFSDNARLRQKAEEKLKEINVAFETLQASPAPVAEPEVKREATPAGTPPTQTAYQAPPDEQA
jgi:hypothetical protein